MTATKRFPKTRTLPILALAGLALMAMPGCWYFGWHEGGDLKSDDKHVYISTTYQPKTIILIDSRSGEKVASWDVPVGKQLAMQFFDDQNKKDAVMPCILKWEIMRAGREGGALHNSIPAPPREARMLDMRLRDVPEYPPDEPEKKAAVPAGD